jgi:DamX protein
MMDAHQLLAAIANGFGLQVTDQPATVLQDMLYQYLVTIKRNDQVPVLFIDDAHELPRDALETLFTLADTETGEGSLLRIILFCEPQIEIMLESPSIQPLRKRITHTINIPAFNEEQTAEYIKHRMAVSGFTGTSPFKPSDIQKIFQVSHGVPARINELAHLHLLSEEYGATDPEILPEEFTRLSFNKKRIAAGAIVIVIVLTGLYLQNSISQLFKSTPEQKQLAIPIPPAINKPPSENIKEKLIALPQKPLSDQQVQPVEAQPDKLLSDEKTKDITTPVVEKTAPVIKARIRSTLPNPVTGSRNKQTILVNGEGFSQDTDVIVGWTGHKKKLARSQITYENRNQLRIHITVGSKADNWTVQSSDPVYGKSNIHAFQVIAEPVNGLQSSAWINQQKPEHFTLQLLGTYNKYSMTSFARQHALEKDTAFFITRRNGKNWYTLIHGHFASREAAQHAIALLPESLQKTEPWIRRFDSIQGAIKTGKTAGSDVPEPVETILNNVSQPQSLDLTAHAAWLWSQNPQYFTIQLLSGHSLDALHSYTQKHQLQKQAIFYRTLRDGKQWFVLLYGSFPDRNHALAAIEKLPEEVRKSRPWPRRFANIHGELTSQ